MGADMYADQILTIISQFEQADCADCGAGLDRHVISPDLMGRPRAWCITDGLADALDDVAAEAGEHSAAFNGIPPVAQIPPHWNPEAESYCRFGNTHTHGNGCPMGCPDVAGFRTR